MSLLGDVATFLVDPTGTLLATKKATEEGIQTATNIASQGANAAQQAASAVAGRLPGLPMAGSATAKVDCCSQFQLVNGFLLNTQSGAVWKYDDKKNKFDPVERTESDLTKAAWGIFNAHFLDQLQQEKAVATTTMHYSVAGQYEKHIGNLVKGLQAKAGQNA